MATFLQNLDVTAGIAGESSTVKWLDRTAFIFLVIMAAAAPHSIAASQSAWLIGMTAWAARAIFFRRGDLSRTAIDLILFAFIGWTVLSSIFSYEPAISLDKLRGVGIFLVLYFAFHNICTLKAAKIVAIVLVASAMVNVVWQPVERLLGRGVQLQGVSSNGPLGKAGIVSGDTILRVGGKRVSTAEEVITELSAAPTAEVLIHRAAGNKTFTVASADILPFDIATYQLGVERWHANHRWRATGFYGHFTTYSEVLQLIGSLVLGMIIAFLFGRRRNDKSFGFELRFTFSTILCASAFFFICIALLLSGTRGSQLGLLASGFAIVIALRSKRLLVIALCLAIPVAAVGYFALLQTREANEDNEYRKTMWSDGLRLATESPRHLLVGVGMDSTRKRWQEFDLFDKGWMPMGHFHSTPIQLAAERGLPALLLWCLFIGSVFARLFRSIRQNTDTENPLVRGIKLGALGGLAGFFVGGLVHYNLGDGEVALAFYLLTGLGLKVAELSVEPTNN